MTDMQLPTPRQFLGWLAIIAAFIAVVVLVVEVSRVIG
jgi:hypothetical protein